MQGRNNHLYDKDKERRQGDGLLKVPWTRKKVNEEESSLQPLADQERKEERNQPSLWKKKPSERELGNLILLRDQRLELNVKGLCSVGCHLHRRHCLNKKPANTKRSG